MFCCLIESLQGLFYLLFTRHSSRACAERFVMLPEHDIPCTLNLNSCICGPLHFIACLSNWPLGGSLTPCKSGCPRVRLTG